MYPDDSTDVANDGDDDDIFGFSLSSSRNQSASSSSHQSSSSRLTERWIAIQPSGSGSECKAMILVPEIVGY